MVRDILGLREIGGMGKMNVLNKFRPDKKQTGN